MDIDLCGPSVPRMLGVQGREIHQSSQVTPVSPFDLFMFCTLQGWLPVYTDQSQSLGVMSIAFLLSRCSFRLWCDAYFMIEFSQDDAVIWRGPKKNAMIKQFLTDVAWGERDVLIIDTPPGTRL